jgi:hypothetical protein
VVVADGRMQLRMRMMMIAVTADWTGSGVVPVLAGCHMTRGVSLSQGSSPQGARGTGSVFPDAVYFD